MAAEPVKPEEVPDTLVRVALDTQYPGYGVSLKSTLAWDTRETLAAVLTKARSQIADFACGEIAMTNAELDLGRDGDPLRVCREHVRRMIEAWPGGYRG